MKRSAAMLVVACISCTPKKTPVNPAIVLSDSSARAEGQPARLMPDTLAVSPQHPLVIRDAESVDSINVFPYSLIFPGEVFDTYIVSFNTTNPTLITLDKSEKVIDSVQLISTSIPATAAYRKTSYAVITGLTHIAVTDSVFTWQTTPAGRRIESSQKIDVKSKTYRINNDGVIHYH